MNQKRIEAIFKENREVVQEFLRCSENLCKMETMVRLCVETLSQGGCIFFAGNGGSAADAQHLAAELTGRFQKERPPLRAEALHVDTSYLTAVANDYGFAQVYQRLLEGKARQGDVLITLSTSGNSENICLALKKAGEMGMKTILWSGKDGGKSALLAQYTILVPSRNTARIQEVHALLGHILCEGIEEGMEYADKEVE